MPIGATECRVLVDGVETVPSHVRTTDARTTPIGRAEITFEREGDVALQDGAPLEVWLGDGLTAAQRVFKGRIRGVLEGDRVGVLALDGMRDLRDVLLLQAFRNVDVHQVFQWAFERAGVTAYTLGSAKTRRSHHFICRNEPLLALFERARATWGLASWDFYADADGEIWFLPWAEAPGALADPVAELVSGENLLDVQPRTIDLGTAETFVLPAIHHSDLVILEDTETWGRRATVRVERVSHEWTKDRARTRVEWAIPAT